VPGRSSSSLLPSGRELLLAAVATLENTQTVQASIRHETRLLGRRVVGRGIYLEQQAQPWRRTRLELSTQVGDQTGTLVQVCDGRYLWTYDSLTPEGRVEKVDLIRVAEAMKQAKPAKDLAGLPGSPGFYGLPKLLGAISRRFGFGQAQPGRWSKARQPVWKLDGRWIPGDSPAASARESDSAESRSAVCPDSLPPCVPDRVVVLLDQQDLFPLRNEFHWTRKTVLGPEAAVAVEFYDVKLDAPIDPTRFGYWPGNLEVVDHTRQLIKRLER